MEFLTCLEGRRSVRRFTEEPLTHPELEELIRRASFAPSWKNTQTVRYLAVEDRAMLDRLAAEAVMGFAGNKAILAGCPALLVLTSISGRAGFERDGSFSTAKGDRWEMFDAGAAAQSLCLAAHDMGLGTVIMGIFDPDRVAQILDIPDGRSVSALVAVGHPAQSPEMPRRKGVEELLEYK